MASAQFDLLFNRLAAAGCNPRSAGASGEHRANCPAHEDAHPSLYFNEGRDGLVIHCQSQGCPVENVIGSLGIKYQDIFYKPIKAIEPKKKKSRSDGSNSKFTAIYNYTDISGNLLFQVCRTPEKQFIQRTPDPAQSGKWIWKCDSSRHVLYRLPEIIKAVSEGKTIYIPEGEKDSDNLRALGLFASCNPGGAGKWKESYSETLRGSKVVLLQDNDEAGQAHCRKAAHSLFSRAAEVRVLLLPGLPQKGDVSDWLRDGGTKEELARLAAVAPLYAGDKFTLEVNGNDNNNNNDNGNGHSKLDLSLFDLTDIGNAHRLIRDHGEDLHFVRSWKSWLVWDGAKWSNDQTGEIDRRAEATASNLYQEAADAARSISEADNSRAAAISRHAVASRSDGRIKAMIERAKAQPSISVLPESFDSDPWLLNCQNGTVDLRTGCLFAHRRTDLLTKSVSASYDPNALCPIWIAFLNRIMNNNSRLISFLQRAAGYALTGNTMEKCLFFLYGQLGNNGKSTFLETLAGLLGSYALAKFPISALIDDGHGNSHSNPSVAQLAGVRFVTGSEVGSHKKFNEELIKDLTGGIDTISAKRLYENPFTFRPTHKLFIYGNNKPNIYQSDNAIWNRLKLIPFTVSIPDSEQDKSLPDKLQAEFSGILSWAVAGCSSWLKDGLAAPDEVERATAAYRLQMDVAGRFLADCCKIGDDEYSKSASRTSSRDLYMAFENWCQSSGSPLLARNTFASKLIERGFESRRSGANGSHCWVGISLVEYSNKNYQKTEVLKQTEALSQDFHTCTHVENFQVDASVCFSSAVKSEEIIKLSDLDDMYDKIDVKDNKRK